MRSIGGVPRVALARCPGTLDRAEGFESLRFFRLAAAGLRGPVERLQRGTAPIHSTQQPDLELCA